MEVKIFSYEVLTRLSQFERINRILKIVRKGNLVLIEGRLKKEEEVLLISKTMENISKSFTGVEIAYLDSKTKGGLVEKIKNKLIKLLAKDRLGITVIGPSKVVKEIKMDPMKIEIFLKK